MCLVRRRSTVVCLNRGGQHLGCHACSLRELLDRATRERPAVGYTVIEDLLEAVPRRVDVELGLVLGRHAGRLCKPNGSGAAGHE